MITKKQNVRTAPRRSQKATCPLIFVATELGSSTLLGKNRHIQQDGTTGFTLLAYSLWKGVLVPEGGRIDIALECLVDNTPYASVSQIWVPHYDVVDGTGSHVTTWINSVSPLQEMLIHPQS